MDEVIEPSSIMAQWREQVFVEAFLAHPSVEALDQAVLHGFARCDVAPPDFAIFLPFENRVAGSVNVYMPLMLFSYR